MLTAMLVALAVICIIGFLTKASPNKVILILCLVLLSIFTFFNPMHPLDLVLIYGVIVIMPVIFIILRKNLFKSFMLWFFLLLFKEFGKIPLPRLPDIKPERVVWFSIISFLFLDMFLKKRKKIYPFTGIEIMMFFFGVYIVISMINAGTIYVEGRGVVLGTFLSGYAVPFSVFFLSKNLVDDRDKIKKLFLFFTVIGFYLGITAIFEHFKVTSLVFPKYIMNQYLGTHWGRARGPFLNASINGAVMGMVLYMVFYLKAFQYKKWMKTFLAFTAFVLVVGILFTYTRACWVALLLSLVVFPLFYTKWRIALLVGMLVLTIGGVMFIGEGIKIEESKTASVRLEGDATLQERLMERATQTNPIYSRLNLYATIGRMFLERPVFGFGFNTFQKVSPEYFEVIEGIPYFGEGLAPHDTLSGVLVELGLVGVGMILYIVFAILFYSMRLYKRLTWDQHKAKRLLVAFWGAYLVYFINIQFIEARYFVFANCVFFMFSGIIVGLEQRSRIDTADYQRAFIDEEPV